MVYVKNNFVTEKDMKELLKFTNKNLGTYNLFYSKYKVHFLSLTIFTCLTVIAIGLSLYCLYCKNQFIDIFSLCTLFFSLITGVLFENMRKKQYLWSYNIERKRLKILKNYYLDKGYNQFALECLIDLLQRELSIGINLNISVILGILLLPIWENYISYLYEKTLDGLQISKVIIALFLRFLLILFAVWCISIIEFIIDYIYKFRRRKIENIIYITRYIIYHENNGKR